MSSVTSIIQMKYKKIICNLYLLAHVKHFISTEVSYQVCAEHEADQSCPGGALPPLPILLHEEELNEAHGHFTFLNKT
jgi:hypothetical protein